MSIFVRPDSPPPRQPSPEFVPAPLPSPHLQARLRKSSSKQSISSSPSLPPGLHLSTGLRNFVHSTRSYEQLGERSERRRASSSPIVSPPTTPPSLPLPSTSLSVDHSRPSRRYPSCATTYRSPPPSPSIPSPPPPVPPIPAFVVTAPKEVKYMHHPSQPMSVSPIRLPDFDNVSPLSESTYIPQPLPRVPPPQKHSGIGMTCLKFFSLRHTKHNTKQSASYTTNA